MRWWRTRARRLEYGGARGQFGVFRGSANGSRAPLVVFVHGGSWATPYNRWAMLLLTRDAARRGWATYNVEYRRLGRGGGGGGWPQTFVDVSDAIRTGVDHHSASAGGPTAVVGHSAGGHLALWAASDVAGLVEGVVSLAGPTDLRRISAGGSAVVDALVANAPVAERWELTSPLEKLPTGVATRCVHGASDQTVSPRNSTEYAEAAVAHGDDASAVVIPGEDHRSPLGASSSMWLHTVEILCGWFDEESTQPDGRR